MVDIVDIVKELEIRSLLTEASYSRAIVCGTYRVPLLPVRSFRGGADSPECCSAVAEVAVVVVGGDDVHYCSEGTWNRSTPEEVEDIHKDPVLEGDEIVVVRLGDS